MKTFFFWLCLLNLHFLSAQDYRWQQRADYDMDIQLQVKTHRLKGTQKLTYTNNAQDTLNQVFYHLYFNAFQPNSMMDVRSRNLPDPDARVMDRISKLKENEIGFQHILSLTQDGEKVTWITEGTILKVMLNHPILPHTQSVFQMEFEAQVPLQIRRSGRDNKEGIAFSMTQWYPKMAEYDHRGWHANQYVAREFHGVWGNFDVHLSLDPSYIVAATGQLQNPQEVGFGYEEDNLKVKRPKGDLTWHFKASNVHDFAWTADPDYQHEKAQVPNGPELHFFFQKGEKTSDNWKNMIPYAVKHFQYMNKHFGKYPYPSYAIIQGGDGGMEYPMCTLITGERTFGSLVGVMTHEVAHSWFQGVLASNETIHAWMDEGFADFASTESMAYLFHQSDPHRNNYSSYFSLVKSGLQEPLSLHSDFFNTNKAYSTAAYSMGAIFLNQLKNIIGEKTFYYGMRQYFEQWKFHHPEPHDFIRVMEKASNIQLMWYLNLWTQTTRHIDYGIKAVVDQKGGALIVLERLGDFPMPLELEVTFKDGSKTLHYIPLNEMLGRKEEDPLAEKRIDEAFWPWVNPTFSVLLKRKLSDIKSITLDPARFLADINEKNNHFKLDFGE